MSQFRHAGAGLSVPSRASRLAPWLWGGFLVVASAIGSFALACVTPFAAFAVIAALSLDLAGALLVATGVWAANQAVGFGMLGYPWTLETALWGGAIGAGTLLAVVVAAQVLRQLSGRGTLMAVTAALAAAFVAYQACLLFAGSWLGGFEEFALPIVAQVAATNLVWAIGLGALYQARRLVVGNARMWSAAR